MIAAMPFAAFAASPVGEIRGGGSSIEWSINSTSHQSVRLVMMDRNGEVVVDRTYAQGRSIHVRTTDLGTDPTAGAYTYELTVTPVVAPGLAKKLAAARAANDDAAVRKIMRENNLEPIVQSGTVTLDGGTFVDPNATETTARLEGDASAVREDVGGATPRTSPSRPTPKVGVNDQVIADDLIVTGSECVGFDCVDGESFGFDTIKMKENNLRIKAEDTSTGTGFPTTDWQLTFNDSASGGANKFSVDDVTAVTTPFTITGAAPTNSIFVGSNGKVGFRTATPVLDLHISTSDTPAIRQEQTNAGGFTAQTWDIGGNEANWFVRDVTGGSRLPLRIRPGAPTSSIDISASGNVGVGTASPQRALHIITTAGIGTTARHQNLATNGYAGIEYVDNSGNIDLFVGVDNAGNNTRINAMNGTPIVFYLDGVEKARINSTGLAITGNMSATGTKSFATPDPADPKNKAIYYAALEGPEAGTYFRGTAKTVNGEITIELPGYFSRITENERMTVQLTAIGAPGQLYVASRSPEKLVIKVADGSADLEFDYLVQGVRKGYLDFEVERANNLSIQK